MFPSQSMNLEFGVRRLPSRNGMNQKTCRFGCGICLCQAASLDALHAAPDPCLKVSETELYSLVVFTFRLFTLVFRAR